MMRRIVGLLVSVVAVLAALVAVAPASSARTGFVVDEIHFGYLPPGLGQPSDFSYHFQRVDFVSRVWESPTHEGWQVDLDAVVMRGARLRSGAALHSWFIRYEHRPRAEVQYVRVSVHGHPGWLCRDQVFWLLRPGLAVSVTLDRTRWSQHQVKHIAWPARANPIVSRAG